MKRLLALAALLLGLSALVAPAQARLYHAADSTSQSLSDRGPGAAQNLRAASDSTQPRTSRRKTVRPLGAPESSTPRTVVLPVIMLADRPLE